MTHFRVPASEIINKYADLVDVKRFFQNVDELVIEDDSNGLLTWSPKVVGDAYFYEQLSAKIVDYYPRNKTEFLTALSFISSSDSVLEIGCGDGSFARLLPGRQWHGVDINSIAIESLLKEGLSCELTDVFSDPDYCPPFVPDVICSFQVIEHLTDPSELFKCAARILPQGNKLIVGFPSLDSIFGIGKNKLAPLNLPPHHQTWWTDKAIIEYPNQFGFSIQDYIHCPLDSIHKHFYFTTLCTALLDEKLGSLPSVVRNSMSWLILKLLQRFLYSSKVMSDTRYGFRGQSSIAVYTRNKG